MNYETKYSVLMSVYYKENPVYLEQSIQSMLCQSIPPSDFVLVCDGPLSKELEEVIQKMHSSHPDLFQILRLKEQQGLGPALNIGLQACRFPLVARMDSDDISLENRCALELARFSDPHIAIVSGTIWEFEGELHFLSKRQLPKSPQEIAAFSRRRNPFNHPAVMFRKDVILEAGGYRPCPFFEDYDLWSRVLSHKWQGYNIQDPVLYMRAGDGMYQRRGGLHYAVYAIRFRYHLYRTGFSSLSDFFVSAGGQLLVSLVPNTLRKTLYRVLLRKD